MSAIGCKPATNAANLTQALANIGIHPTFVSWEVRRSRIQGYMRLLNLADLRRAANLIDPDDATRQHLSEDDLPPWTEVYVGSWALAHTDEAGGYQ